MRAKKIIILSFILLVLSLLLSSCAPVLNREYMEQGARAASFKHIRDNPEQYKGKLFILGGAIVDTKFVEKGSQIEAVYIPVDSYGYLKDSDRSQGRFLAFYPKEKALLDPVVYRKGRGITIAAEFSEMRTGKIDDMEYSYPVFEIKQIYLWDERREYYLVPYDPWYYPWYYYSYPYYNPWWWYPVPYPYLHRYGP